MNLRKKLRLALFIGIPLLSVVLIFGYFQLFRLLVGPAKSVKLDAVSTPVATRVSESESKPDYGLPIGSVVSSMDESERIVVIDPAKGEIVLDLASFDMASDIAMSPSGVAYAVAPWSRALIAIDSRGFDESRRMVLPESVIGIAVGEDETIYVTDIEAAELIVIDSTDMTVSKKIPVGREPQNVAVSRDGTIYVTHFRAGTMSVIEPGTSVVARTVKVGTNPTEVEVTSDGTVFVVNREGGTVAEIKPGANQVTKFHTVGETIMGIAVGPDDSVWAGDFFGDRLVRLATGSHKQQEAVNVPGCAPWGLAVSQDGTVFTACLSLQIIAVSAETMKQTHDFFLDEEPLHLAAR